MIRGSIDSHKIFFNLENGNLRHFHSTENKTSKASKLVIFYTKSSVQFRALHEHYSPRSYPCPLHPVRVQFVLVFFVRVRIYENLSQLCTFYMKLSHIHRWFTVVNKVIKIAGKIFFLQKTDCCDFHNLIYNCVLLDSKIYYHKFDKN